jgi:hypothetical protein
MGIWLGALGWFGGYVLVRNVVGCVAIGLSCCVVILRWRYAPARWPRHIGYFLASQFVLIVGISAGQVWYAAPNGAAEAMSLFGLAIQGRL